MSPLTFCFLDGVHVIVQYVEGRELVIVQLLQVTATSDQWEQSSHMAEVSGTMQSTPSGLQVNRIDLHSALLLQQPQNYINTTTRGSNQ